MLEFAIKLHDECLHLTEQLTFNKKLGQERLFVSLYCRLIELSGGMATLISTQRTIGVPMVFRSFLETYADFMNVLADPNYQHRMEVTDLRKRIELLKNSRKNNRYSKELSRSGITDKELPLAEEQLNKLEKGGYKRLNVWDRFEMAGMEDEYRSIYNHVCGKVHGSVSALIQDHIIRDDDTFKVVIYQGRDHNDFTAELAHNAQYLIIATGEIHERLKSDCHDKIQELIQELDAITRELE